MATTTRAGITHLIACRRSSPLPLDREPVTGGTSPVGLPVFVPAFVTSSSVDKDFTQVPS